MSTDAAGRYTRTAETGVLTQEQEEILDMYLQRLDTFYESLKAAEALQVEVETLHLKKILTT